MQGTASDPEVLADLGTVPCRRWTGGGDGRADGYLRLDPNLDAGARFTGVNHLRMRAGREFVVAGSVGAASGTGRAGAPEYLREGAATRVIAKPDRAGPFWLRLNSDVSCDVFQVRKLSTAQRKGRIRPITYGPTHQAVNSWSASWLGRQPDMVRLVPQEFRDPCCIDSQQSTLHLIHSKSFSSIARDNAQRLGQRATGVRTLGGPTYGHFRRGCWSVPCCCSPGDPPGGRSRLGLLRERVISPPIEKRWPHAHYLDEAGLLSLVFSRSYSGLEKHCSYTPVSSITATTPASATDPALIPF